MATATALRPMNFPTIFKSEPVIGNQMIAGLSEKTSAALRKVSMPLAYSAGDTLFTEGEVAKGVFILRQGKVKLVASSSEGKALILRIATTGAILGLSPAVAAKTHDISAAVLEPSQVSFIKRADLLQLMNAHGDLALQLAKELSLEYASLCQELSTIGLQRSAMSRLAQLLASWIETEPAPSQEVQIDCNLTHEVIAQLIGTSRETVTRLLHDLRTKNIATLKNEILTIHHMPKLRSLVG